MVLAAPRSGTAWAANWLNTDNTRCLHDPLWRHHYDDLDKIESDKDLGISCTGLALHPTFLRHHLARKVVLHRPFKEINDSLARLGQNPLGKVWETALDQIPGMHAYWDDLFHPIKARPIYEYLLDRRFDPERHHELVDLNVQMNFGSVTINKAANARMFEDLRRIQESLK